MARFPPPEVLASWPEPNFVDPINRGPALMIVELTILPIALVCLALRLYVRLCIIRKSWWDDWLMVGGAVFASGVTVCVILATQFYGWNLHVWDLTPQQMQQGRQISIAAQTIFLFASGLTKLSMLASYLRIAPLGSAFRKLTWATIYVVFALIWIFIIVLWTQCIPVAHYWHLSPSSADSCIGEWPPLAAQAITTVVTDLIVTVLPMPTLWKLRLPVYQRIGLMVLFGFGLPSTPTTSPGTALPCGCGLPSSATLASSAAACLSSAVCCRSAWAGRAVPVDEARDPTPRRRRRSARPSRGRRRAPRAPWSWRSRGRSTDSRPCRRGVARIRPSRSRRRGGCR